MRLTGSGLRASRGGRLVFADLGFAVAAGDLLSVVGPNGAGKSTFLRLVAGLLEPDAGAVRFDPEPDGGRGTAIHYLGHLDALKRTLTVGENLAFWRRLWTGDGVVADALDAVELEGRDDLPVATLSAGQRRRVALARLLLANRPVWLLDEPATSLDAGVEAMLGRLIARHRAGGGIVIAATHRDLAATPTMTLAIGRAP